MPSFFQGASQIDARSGNFTQYNVHHADFAYTAGLEPVLASLKPVAGSYVQPCMSGTRQWMMDKIHQWLGDNQVPNILWLSGSPGAGKSTIASTLVSDLQATGRLGSSFFCERDDVALSDPAACWRTIAFDLARYDSVIAKRMVENMSGRKVDPGRADIELHFKYLIEEPLQELWRSRAESLARLHTDMGVDVDMDIEASQARDGKTAEMDKKMLMGLPVVVLDALNECGSDDSQFAQRETFINTITYWSHLPALFKLVVTSRDDRIPNTFRTVCHHISLDTGDIAGPEAIDDVRVFIEKRCAIIAARNNSLPPTWPGGKIIKQLANRAAGLFVWADTIVKFVEHGIPNKRLNSILQDQFHYGEERLDGLYRQVLNLAFKNATDDELEIYKLVIGAIVLAKTPFRRQDLRYFLGREEEEASITSILLNLSSVVSTRTAKEFIHVSHLSFTEFICDPSRCGELFAIHRDTHNQVMALACLKIMRTGLQFNICRLETSHVRNVDITDLASRIDKFIPTHLSYSCRFWSDHLRTAKIGTETIETVWDFLNTSVLYWLEVMSLIKEVNVASQALMSVHDWIGAHDEDLYLFATDIGKFVSTFGSVISQSAPHIYISALPFAPAGSRVARQFLPHFTGTLSFVTEKPADWPTILNVLEGHDGRVTSVGFSRDGKHIVSGSWDKTICIWDVETGDVVSGPFKGHANRINSVMFSPDGKRVVSGSDDRTVRIWDTEMGDVVSRPFEGHTSIVISVAFSHDGKRIVSGSLDMTILVWNAKTGEVVSGSFGHTGWVNSVAFSHNDKLIVSGSTDGTIRVWDVDTGEAVLEPFKGHMGGIRSVAFSPDSDHIVSGSDDNTVRIWDAQTGGMVLGPFKGHTDVVGSVAFSPNGRWILSGSYDKTIRIWDTGTGEVSLVPFEGHTDRVTSVAFSPVDKRIVSGSFDTTIRVWETETGGLVSEGHTERVSSVAFSPDGERIVSGSYDKTIRIWDAMTGQAVSGPFKGHTSRPCAVAFLSDSRRVVSASYDQTICVWDAQTGEVVSGPFKGHTENVNSVALSYDGKRLVSGSYDGTICIRDTETGAMVLEPFQGHSNWVSSIAFSHNGKRFVSHACNSMMRVWNTETGDIVSRPFKGQPNATHFVALSPNGKHIVSDSWDGTIRVWDVETGDVVSKPFEGHNNWVRSVAFSSDGKHIVSGSTDKTVCVWDAKTGAVVLGPFEGHTSDVMSVAFSPDGSRIISGSDDKTIRVWDVETHAGATQPSNDHSGEIRYVHDTQITNNRPTPTMPSFGDSSKIVDGWILGSNSELLFWVPPVFRDGLWWPRNTAVMAKLSTKLDFKSFVHGHSWARCKT